MVKNCDRGLENSTAEGSISRPRSQFFTIWTIYYNIFIFFKLDEILSERTQIRQDLP